MRRRIVGVVRMVALLIALSSALSAKSNDKTVIAVEEIERLKDGRMCTCLRDPEVIKKGDEHLRLLLRISSVRLVSALQNLAHHANAEINYLIQRARSKLYEEIAGNFPRLLTQSSAVDSIEELIHRIRTQLFVSSDLTPAHVESEMESAVQSFFVQLLPATFLCMSTGPCRAVTQAFASCLHRNAPSWRSFYGDQPTSLPSSLRRTVLKYRIIERTIDKLHRSALEIEDVNSVCVSRYTAVAFCGSDCAGGGNDREGSIGYCAQSCRDVVRGCLGDAANDWDSFISILRKLTVDFDYGFTDLVKGVVEAITHAVEQQAPSIAKAVLAKCGPANVSRSVSSGEVLQYSTPNPVQRKVVSLVRQFSSYTGWWGRLAANVCSDPSKSSTCWNGTAVISSAEIDVKPANAKLTDGTQPSASHRIVEGSGHMEWSDDEDFSPEGSGSGEPEPFNPVVTVPDVAHRHPPTHRPPVIPERPTVVRQMLVTPAPPVETHTVKKAATFCGPSASWWLSLLAGTLLLRAFLTSF